MINGIKIEDIGEFEIIFKTKKGLNGRFNYNESDGEVLIDIEEFYSLGFCRDNLIREIFPKKIEEGKTIKIDDIEMKILYVYVEKK